MIIWANVVAIAPELATTSSATQTAILGAVGRQVGPKRWGARQPDGQAYLAAHLATLARLRGSGMVTQEAVDRLSRSYFLPNWLKSSLGLTAYGMEYKRLIRLLPTVLGAVF